MEYSTDIYTYIYTSILHLLSSSRTGSFFYLRTATVCMSTVSIVRLYSTYDLDVICVIHTIYVYIFICTLLSTALLSIAE
jgi:hypothetical protein